MTEHDIQNEIRLALTEHSFCVFRANVGKVKTLTGWFSTGLPTGFSDLFAIKNGKIYFIEVKKQGNIASDEQKHFLDTMRDKYGCIAGVCYSVSDALRLVGVTDDT